MEVLDALDQTADTAKSVVNGVRPDQLSQPTPCADWDVRALMSHLAGVGNFFGAVARREDAVRQAGFADSASRDEAVDAVATAVRNAAGAWRTEGALDGTVQLPAGDMPRSMAAGVNLVDMYVHTWDIAKATDQRLPDNPELVATVSTFAHQIMRPEIRQRGAFGPEIGAAENASDLNRLLAFLGREP